MWTSHGTSLRCGIWSDVELNKKHRRMQLRPPMLLRIKMLLIGEW